MVSRRCDACQLTFVIVWSAVSNWSRQLEAHRIRTVLSTFCANTCTLTCTRWVLCRCVQCVETKRVAKTLLRHRGASTSYAQSSCAGGHKRFRDPWVWSQDVLEMALGTSARSQFRVVVQTPLACREGAKTSAKTAQEKSFRIN